VSVNVWEFVERLKLFYSVILIKNMLDLLVNLKQNIFSFLLQFMLKINLEIQGYS